MPTSVRLDNETEVLLLRLAHSSGCSKSDIMREALRHLAAERGNRQSEGPYTLISDLVGIAEDGPEDLARSHKSAFREALSRKDR